VHLEHPLHFMPPIVRRLRTRISTSLEPFFDAFGELVECKYVEMLGDRFRLQKAGTKVGGEDYHRDESKET
jgi:hypothetical protein